MGPEAWGVGVEIPYDFEALCYDDVEKHMVRL